MLILNDLAHAGGQRPKPQVEGTASVASKGLSRQRLANT